MTRFKKLKKAIRARSRKTGESYAAARQRVLELRRKRLPEEPAPARDEAVARPRLRPAAASVRGGTTDAMVLARTGHGLDHWFDVLDRFGAAAKGHTAAARHLYDDHGVPGWYAQGVTVEYERARGLRAPNQTRDGRYQVSVTKVVPASVRQVADALRDSRRRASWLRPADPDLARALAGAFASEKARGVIVKDGSNARLRFRWDESTVEIRVTGKPNGGSSVAVGNMNLAQADAVERRRAQWRAALESLKQHLGR